MTSPGPYPKRPLTATEHIALLESRGVQVPPEQRALAYHLLGTVGYFRLAGYALAFQLQPGAGVPTHQCRPGTRFAQIADLYQFDEALRHQCWSALQRIEVAFKAVVCNKLCGKHQSGHWFDLPGVFLPTQAPEVLRRIHKALEFDPVRQAPIAGRKPGVTPYLDNYYAKYHGPAPSWMLREVGSFGLWSLMYASLAHNPDRQMAANEFKYPDRKPLDQELLRGWMHSLAVFRNLCAHHHRLVCKNYPFVPATPGRAPWNTYLPANQPTLRSVLTVLAFLERATVQGSTWLSEMRSLFDAFDTRVDINRAVGFRNAQGWRTDALWNLPA